MVEAISIVILLLVNTAFFILMLNYREEKGWWEKDSKYWSDRALTAEEERDFYRRLYAELENALTWDTTCLNCSSLLDRSYEDYVKAEKLQIQSDKVQTLHPEPEVAGSICTGCGYVYPCPTVRALTDEVEDPGVQAYKSL